MAERPNLLAGEDLPNEPIQKRSLDKRSRLKAAGLSLFGEKGYAGTSVDEVAQRADLAVGGFYQRFRSKRQLLLVLMDDLLEALSRMDPHPEAFGDVRAGVHGLLSHAFSHDFRYLGAYRAWVEAVLSDSGLARKNEEIRAWTTGRVTLLFQFLQKMPGARPNTDTAGLARAMDTLFWSILSEAARGNGVDVEGQVNAATYLIYHALFQDAVGRRVGRQASRDAAARRSGES